VAADTGAVLRRAQLRKQEEKETLVLRNSGRLYWTLATDVVKLRE
jgi:hypothetical protein